MNKQFFNTNLLYEPTTNEIVAQGIHNHRRWFVVAYHGHPNAYVQIHYNEFTSYDRSNELEYLPVQVHGGLTFGGHLPILPVRSVVGWDYAHYKDFVMDGISSQDTRIWSVDEIVDECIYVCGQLDAISNYEK